MPTLASTGTSYAGRIADMDPATIVSRVHGGGDDEKRANRIDAIVQRAQMGDPNALQELAQKGGLLGGKGSTGSHGTHGVAGSQDAQNYARMWYEQLTGENVDYRPPQNWHPKDLGDTLGGIVKIAAPIAAAFIPGVGPMGAAAIGGLGSAAGGAIAGDKFDLGKTLLAGAAGAAGNALLGNGLGSVPGRTVGYTPTGVVEGASGGGLDPIKAAAAAGKAPMGGAGGIGGLLGGAGDLLQKYGPLVVGGMGAIGAGKLGSQAEDLRNQAARVAMRDYQQRAPLREAAVTGLTGPRPQREDLSGLYADPSNPYRRPVARMAG